MADGRKEAIKEYKARKVARGIFAVRCTATGEVWVDASPNLGSVRNRLWFQLRHGQHRNVAMQAAWNENGEQSFQCEVVETFAEDVPAIILNDLSKKRKQYWLEQLGAAPL